MASGPAIVDDVDMAVIPAHRSIGQQDIAHQPGTVQGMEVQVRARIDWSEIPIDRDDRDVVTGRDDFPEREHVIDLAVLSFP